MYGSLYAMSVHKNVDLKKTASWALESFLGVVSQLIVEAPSIGDQEKDVFWVRIRWDELIY